MLFNKLSNFRIFLICAVSGFIQVPLALATTSNWVGPGSDFNNAVNWSAGTPTDIAAFNTATPTSLSLSKSTILNGLTFTSGASSYDINIGDRTTLYVMGTGITNNSGKTQTISNFSILGDPNLGARLFFENASTAGNASIINQYYGSTTQFFNTSTAGNANILNIGNQVGGGSVAFHNTSTAGQATLTNTGDLAAISFFDSSTAGNATINNNSQTSHGGLVSFNNTSSAGTSKIVNNGNGQNSNGSLLTFNNNATADHATITNNGYSGTLFTGLSTAGNAAITNNGVSSIDQGTLSFKNGSNAGNATISNNSGSTFFHDNTSANQARIVNNGLTPDNEGSVSFNNSSTAGNATIFNYYGSTFFHDSSTAGTSAIVNNQYGSSTQFFDIASAGNAQLTNNGTQLGGGDITFHNNSSAGQSSLTNNGGSSSITFLDASTAGNATILNNASTSRSGFVSFHNTSTAEHASIVNNGNGQNTTGSLLSFNDAATAGNAVITNNNYSGTQFYGVSTGGNATLTNNAGGSTSFFENSTGGNAALVNNAGGFMNIGSLNSSGMSIGSVSNAGSVNLGSKTLSASRYSGTGTLSTTLASASTYGKLAVSGNANVSGGTLNVSVGNSFLPTKGENFTVVTAGSLTGEFATLVQPASVQFTTEYTPQSLILQTNGVNYSHAMQTPNQMSTALSLDALQPTATNDLTTVTGALNTLDTQQLQSAIDQMSLTALNSINQMDFAGDDAHFAGLNRRYEAIATQKASEQDAFAYYNTDIDKSNPQLAMLVGSDPAAESLDIGVGMPAPAKNQSPWGYFASGIGGFGKLDTTMDSMGLQPGYSFSMAGATFGADYRVNDQFTWGGSGGYVHNHSLSDLNSSTVDAQSIKFGTYGVLHQNNWNANGYVGGAEDLYSTNRNMVIGTINRTATAAPSGEEFNTRWGVGYDYKMAQATLQPTAAVEYDRIMLHGFSESGADALDLSVGPQTAQSLRTELGSRLTQEFVVGRQTWVPYISAAWQHEYENQSSAINAEFASGTDSAFTYRTADAGRDSALLGAGTLLQLTNTSSLFFNYVGEFGRANFYAHTFNGGFRYKFA